MDHKEQQVSITYQFDFPRSVVFDAWVSEEALKEWFAPQGCTISFRKLHIVQGGSYHSCVSNPTYGDCWCIGEYKEISAPERIVFTMVNADSEGQPIDPAAIGMDPEWPGETVVTVSFEEANGQTTVYLKQTVSEALAKKTGAYPSWIQMLDRLGVLMSQKKGLAKYTSF